MKPLTRMFAGILASLVFLVALSPAAQASSFTDWLDGILSYSRPATSNSQPSASTPTPNRLPVVLGLGDSIAAGDGLPLPASPTADEQQCRRSQSSYVDLVARERGLQPVNLACSGARIFAGLQVAQEFEYSNASSTKRTAQLSLAQQYARPEVVAVTIGANSVAWYQWLSYCRVANCGSQRETNSFRYAFLAPAKADLVVAAARIVALNPGQIVFTGYYDPAAGDASCLEPAGYSPAEISWIRARLNDLNQAIAEVAAATPRASYAAVNFGDRGLCSSRPLVQGLSAPAPLHPTAEGQEVIARAVEAQLR